jgi:hypothetical protein
VGGWLGLTVFSNQSPVSGSRGQRVGRQAGGSPWWQCWGPRAVTQNEGGDAVKGDQDCRWPVRTGADETGWRTVTQDAWEERQTDRQTDREEIHGIAPEHSPWSHPDTWHCGTVTGTELEPAKTQMNGEDGIFVLGKG